MKKKVFALIAAFCFAALSEAGAAVKMPTLISDGMVIQREASVNIWGTSDSDKPIVVKTSWDNKTYKTKPADNGEWSVAVATGKAGGPYTITVSQGKDKTAVEDVLVGEVWVCCGQSNMQMPVMGYLCQPMYGSTEALLEAPSFAGSVRLFCTPRTFPEDHTPDLDTKWEVCSASSAAPFSAIGYFFATKLSKALGVPVGMIENDWGGTRIQAWMSEEAVRAVEENPSEGDWLNKMGLLWRTRVEPVTKYTLRGFLWYQGESNKGQHAIYDKLMAAMVKEWRKAWNANNADAPALTEPQKKFGDDGDQMPFLFAQLAPFDYNNPNDWFEGKNNDILLPLMWESQLRAVDLIPNSDIAVSMDLGSAHFIHPPYKKELADRFLLLAYHDVYDIFRAGYDGRGIDWRGPILKSVRYEDGKAIVTFNSETPLSPVDPFNIVVPVVGFELAGEDRVFHPADAQVLHNGYLFSNDVEVSCPEVPNPVAVRYAFDNIPGELNLMNTLELPAFPFRTDDWDDVQ